MAKNLISAASLKNIKPRTGRKLTKYHDGEGLYLWVFDVLSLNHHCPHEWKRKQAEYEAHI